MNKEKIQIKCKKCGRVPYKWRCIHCGTDNLHIDHIEKLYRSNELSGDFISHTCVDDYHKIKEELKRAEEKHPDYPDDMFRQVAILNEEAGEVTKEVLHYHYENGSKENIKKELIQTAAMCVRMLKNLRAV